MCIISLNEEKKQAFFGCIVCPSTLFRPREIALFSDMAAGHWCLSLSQIIIISI